MIEFFKPFASDYAVATDEMYDNCVIGINSKGGLIYSMKLIFEKLAEDGMTLEESQEFFEYNIDTFICCSESDDYIYPTFMYDLISPPKKTNFAFEIV